MQSLSSNSNRCCSLPHRHLEQSPPSVVVVVIVATINSVTAIIVIVDIPCPSNFHRPKLIVDWVYRNTLTPLLPPTAFVVVLAPLLLLPPVVGRRCSHSPLVGRHPGRSPPSGDFTVTPLLLQSVLGWGKTTQIGKSKVDSTKKHNN